MTTFEQIKKHEEYKELCKASKKKPTSSVPVGYNLWDIIDDENGFCACIYQKDQEMIIVYRSSDDKQDWLDSNKSMALGHMPSQAKNAIEVYDMVAKFCSENHMTISVVGFSLGGSLAQIVGALRNANAVTFNAYGVKNLLPDNILNYKEEKITNYCNKHDPITLINAQNHIGKCYTLKSKDIFKNPHYLENMGSLYEREEAYAPYLQSQYEREERARIEVAEYKKYGRHIMHMPGMYSHSDNSECSGSYPVSGYTRDDGTKVDGYIRTCFKHGY